MSAKGFLKPIRIVDPIKGNNIWCPCCDDWHMHDTFSNRRRLGEHLANKHYDEIAFPEDVIPESVEE